MIKSRFHLGTFLLLVLLSGGVASIQVKGSSTEQDILGLEGGQTKDQVEAIRKFDVGGLTFGTSLDAFKKRFPDARELRDDDPQKVRLKTFLVFKKLNGSDISEFDFVDDKLYQIKLTYRSETVSDVGGMKAIIAQLVDKYGLDKVRPQPVEAEGKKVLKWIFAKIDRGIIIEADSESTLVYHIDLVGYRKRMQILGEL